MEAESAKKPAINLPERVRVSCGRVMAKAQHVKISQEALATYVASILETKNDYYGWEENDFHLSDGSVDVETKLAYIFVLDTLNFCFWPSGSWKYCDLAKSLTELIKSQRETFNPSNLAKISLDFVKKNIFKGVDFPLLEERHRVLVELGTQTAAHFDGKYTNIVLAAKKSAVRLVEIVTQNFVNLQDHVIYNGEQIFMYKRAQILVGDIWGAFKGASLGEFEDISELTMFPDYRVPQILRHLGIMVYDEELAGIVDGLKIMDYGGKHEIEIRAATVIAVEQMKEMLKSKGKTLSSVEIDWMLWQKGEELKDSIKPHHRTLSIFY